MKENWLGKTALDGEFEWIYNRIDMDQLFNAYLVAENNI